MAAYGALRLLPGALVRWGETHPELRWDGDLVPALADQVPLRLTAPEVTALDDPRAKNLGGVAGFHALAATIPHEWLGAFATEAADGIVSTDLLLLGGRHKCVETARAIMGALARRHVVTIEGLNGPTLNRVQQAFVDRGASQCGFCTPGFVVALTGHLLETATWSRTAMVEAVAGNICRCTGYSSIVRVIDDLVEHLQRSVDPAAPRVAALVGAGIIPDAFLRAPDLLAEIPPSPTPVEPDGTALIVAGGTDLYVQRPLAVEDGPVVVLHAAEAPPIRRDGNRIVIEGFATAEDLKRSPLLATAIGGIIRVDRMKNRRSSASGTLKREKP